MFDSDSSERSSGKSYGNKFTPYDSFLSKLLKDRFLCDVIIRVNATTVPVHRVILSASSCFFYDLFKNVETINQEYDLTNVFIEPDNLDKILIYIYDGYVKIYDDNILSLLTMNEVLGISSLNNHCAQYLLSKLRTENVLEIWQTAWKYSLQELANVSQIICRETLCEMLISRHHFTILCEEFLSYVLSTKVMMTLSPNFVLRILVWWTSERKFDHEERSEKLLALLNIYLSWKTLSEIELEDLIGNIRGNLELDLHLSNSRLESWSRDIRKKTSQLATIDGIDEKAIDNSLKNARSLDDRQNWSLLVAESDIVFVGIFCNTKYKWLTLKTVVNHLDVIGFFNNILVLRSGSNTLLLQNMQDMTLRTLTASTFADDDSVQFIDTQNSTFFMHLNNIYCIDAVMRTTEKDIICIINRWDQQRNEWITVLRLNTELSSDILSVSLTVEISDGDDVYLFMTLGISHKLVDNTSEPTAFTGKFVISFGEENTAVSQKLLKMFYVFYINMKDFSYRQIGKRRNEPADLNACRKMFLPDKIIFILDPDRDLERKFGYAYLNKNDCFLSCLQLLLNGENCWLTLRLRAPFPDVRDISIRKRDMRCLDCSVTTCKNLLFVGIHWSPHVFQVFKYDISTFTVSSLPAIPLPATHYMSINALVVYQPIDDLIGEEIRFSVYWSNDFEDWSLLSWDGNFNLNQRNTTNNQWT